MTSRNRRVQSNYNLQAGALSLNGTVPPGLDSGAQADGAGASASSPGKIEVSPRAISHLASRTAQRSYGVVGLASRHSRPGWAELLRREEEYKGVEVSFSDGTVIINLYVILEYGTRISEVARNIMSSVRFAVESALGVSAVQVNVTVQGVRVSQ